MFFLPRGSEMTRINDGDGCLADPRSLALEVSLQGAAGDIAWQAGGRCLLGRSRDVHGAALACRTKSMPPICIAMHPWSAFFPLKCSGRAGRATRVRWLREAPVSQAACSPTAPSTSVQPRSCGCPELRAQAAGLSQSCWDSGPAPASRLLINPALRCALCWL